MKSILEFKTIIKEPTLDEIKTNFPNVPLGVAVHIEDKRGNVMLQMRGNNTRDKSGEYELIGGGIELEDKSFKSAILRELKEEVGNNLKLKFENKYAFCRFPRNCGEWICVIFFATIVSGKPQILETEKCAGYEFRPFINCLNSTDISDRYLDVLSEINNHNLREQII